MPCRPSMHSPQLLAAIQVHWKKWIHSKDTLHLHHRRKTWRIHWEQVTFSGSFTYRVVGPTFKPTLALISTLHNSAFKYLLSGVIFLWTIHVNNKLCRPAPPSPVALFPLQPPPASRSSTSSSRSSLSTMVINKLVKVIINTLTMSSSWATGSTLKMQIFQPAMRRAIKLCF